MTDPPSSMLPSVAGATAEGPRQRVRREAVLAYALATLDDDGLYARLSLAPPAYAGVVTFPPITDILFEVVPTALVGTSVHLAQFMRFHRHLRVDDVVMPVATVVSVRSTPFGSALCFHATVVDADGQLVNEAIHDVLLRGVRGKPGGTEPSRPRFVRGSASRRLGEAVFDIASDQSLRYSRASGDVHPIHNDIEVARTAGFPDLILHGMCTFAMCGQAVVRHAADGDPRRLLSLGVTFTHPVIVGRPLHVAVDGGANGQVGVVARQQGRPVTRYGVAELSPPAEP